MLFPKKHSFLDFLYKNVYPTIECTFKKLISVLVMQKTISIYDNSSFSGGEGAVVICGNLFFYLVKIIKVARKYLLYTHHNLVNIHVE